MVSIKVELKVVGSLSNGDVAGDLECPLTAPNHPIFCILTGANYCLERKSHILGDIPQSRRNPAITKSSVPKSRHWRNQCGIAILTTICQVADRSTRRHKKSADVSLVGLHLEP